MLPVIDERSNDVTKVVFPNGRVNYVLLARKTSDCPILRTLHRCMTNYGLDLDDLLSKLEKKRLLKDDLGGGRYVASGYGNMGRNVPPSIRPPDQPALRKCLKFAEHHELAKIIGPLVSRISECIATHCGSVYQENQRLMTTNQKVAWPPLEYQETYWKWMSTQFVVRRWGPGLRKLLWPLSEMMVAAHTDTGDLDCYMFHCYRTGGGKDGKGGPVAGTDIAIFQDSEGGQGFRVKTCIEDTIVIVVLNGKRQLHGSIRNADSFIEDESAWSTRIIPFIPQGVYNWMIRHPTDPPFNSIP